MRPQGQVPLLGTHKVPLIQQKRELVQALLSQPHQNGHSWAPFRTGVACQNCKQRIHTKSPIQELREALQIDCAVQLREPVKRKTRAHPGADGACSREAPHLLGPRLCTLQPVQKLQLHLGQDSSGQL